MATRYYSYIPLFAATLLWAACGNEKSISDRIALSEIAYYIESNPIYDTANMDYGEIKISQQADSGLLAAYERLERGGYVAMERLKSRKKFLSKDSTFTYLVKLTDKSIPFVLEKTDKKVTVKTFEYTLDEDGGVLVEQTGKKPCKGNGYPSKDRNRFR